LSVFRIAVALLFAAWLAACGKSRQLELDPAAVAHPLRGQVVRVNAREQVVTIRHEKIDGWMDAMTMEFPVTDEPVFQALHAGDRVTATVRVGKQSFWIQEIHREF
jgi:Cu/Ag efflux protein CusF